MLTLCALNAGCMHQMSVQRFRWPSSVLFQLRLISNIAFDRSVVATVVRSAHARAYKMIRSAIFFRNHFYWTKICDQGKTCGWKLQVKHIFERSITLPCDLRIFITDCTVHKHIIELYSTVKTFDLWKRKCACCSDYFFGHYNCPWKRVRTKNRNSSWGNHEFQIHCIRGRRLWWISRFDQNYVVSPCFFFK